MKHFFENGFFEASKVKILKNFNKNKYKNLSNFSGRRPNIFVLLYFVHALVSSFITIMVLFSCWKDRSLAKKLSEFLEPWSLSELWEPLCRTDGSNPSAREV